MEKLNSKQSAFVKLIENGKNVMATGAAGTGKSFLLRYLREQYPQMPVTASTGIAALGVGGCTIHSWAGLGLGKEPAAKIAGRHLDRKNSVWYSIKTAKRLAIDEISMIDAEIFTKLDAVLKLVRRSDKPFGGIQLILFGDFLQLPPVGTDGRPVRFAFESDSWIKAKISVFVLDEVMRQKDKAFSDILSRVRVGDSSEDVRAVLRKRINAQDEAPNVEPVTLTTHNAIADGINSEKLNAIDSDSATFEAADWSSNEYHGKTLDRNCIAPKTLELKVGAQVMLLWNVAVDEGLANGSLGVITELKEDTFGMTPVVKFTNGVTTELEKQEWKIERSGEVLASRRQFPLRLSWAISIHKSQGLTLEKVRVHLKRCFADGQAYVAMSRAKTLEGLFIADISGNSIRANSTALEFYKLFTAA